MNDRQDRVRNTIEEQAVEIAQNGGDAPDKLLQLLILEVLLDIRDTLYRTEQDKPMKWGSHL